jgi:hypothetical protein
MKYKKTATFPGQAFKFSCHRRFSKSTVMNNHQALGLFYGNDLQDSQEGSIFAVLPGPQQHPIADDWDRLRPIIKRLYIDEDLTLDKVMNIMLFNYGHKGT